MSVPSRTSAFRHLIHVQDGEAKVIGSINGKVASYALKRCKTMQNPESWPCKCLKKGSCSAHRENHNTPPSHQDQQVGSRGSYLTTPGSRVAERGTPHPARTTHGGCAEAPRPRWDVLTLRRRGHYGTTGSVRDILTIGSL